MLCFLPRPKNNEHGARVGGAGWWCWSEDMRGAFCPYGWEKTFLGEWSLLSQEVEERGGCSSSVRHRNAHLVEVLLEEEKTIMKIPVACLARFIFRDPYSVFYLVRFLIICSGCAEWQLIYMCIETSCMCSWSRPFLGQSNTPTNWILFYILAKWCHVLSSVWGYRPKAAIARDASWPFLYRALISARTASESFPWRSRNPFDLIYPMHSSM